MKSDQKAILDLAKRSDVYLTADSLAWREVGLTDNSQVNSAVWRAVYSAVGWEVHSEVKGRIEQ